MKPLDIDAISPTRAEVRARQIEQCYRHLPISLAVNVVNAAIVAAVFWDAIGRSRVISWLSALALVTLARYASLRAYSGPRGPGAPENGIWERHLVLGAAAGGLVWGAAGVLLFHPQSFPHQVLLAFVLGGMVAGAIPLLAPLRTAYWSFAIPVVVPISVSLLAEGDRIHVMMGLMVLIFGVAMLLSSVQVQRLFQDTIELRLKLMSSLKAGQMLQQMAYLDELTGIANRRLFEEALEREWKRAQRAETGLAVITADVDHFKAYNDHYGHPMGDACLRAVAQAMAHAVHRPGDVVARLGGEEFGFLLPETTLEGATTIADRIRRSVLALNLPHPASPAGSQVTVSLGAVSADPDGAATAADLLRASDVALYEAKHRGRNRVASRRLALPQSS